MSEGVEPGDELHGATRLDEDRLLAKEPYEILDTPTLRHQYRFLERGTDGDGDYFSAEFRFDADAISLEEHVHPQQEETFKVLAGELEIQVGGEDQTLVAGEDITLPAGVPHYHGIVSGVETRVLYEIRPPMAQEEAFRALSTLGREGRLNDHGGNMLAFAVFLNANPDMFYLAEPSVRVQKLLFTLLAPIGRLRGYKTDYSPK